MFTRVFDVNLLNATTTPFSCFDLVMHRIQEWILFFPDFFFLLNTLGDRNVFVLNIARAKPTTHLLYCSKESHFVFKQYLSIYQKAYVTYDTPLA